MKFTTANGETYTIDRVHNVLSSEGMTPMPFKYVTNLYTGSEGVAFHGENGEIIRYVSDVISVVGNPNERVSGEEGNLVVRTQNSSYEFNQEQRIFRRLAGLNPATDPNVLDGDWQPYIRIESLAVGWSPLVVYDGAKLGKVKALSRVREIEGIYVEPPLANAVADDISANPTLLADLNAALNEEIVDRP